MRLPADLDARSLSDLRALVIALVVKGTELERTVAAQRDEIARLKGLKGRPQIKPSGMEKASQALTQERAAGKRRRKRAKSADLTIHEERIIKAGPVPPGSRFKGYQTFVVQDLVLRSLSCACGASAGSPRTGRPSRPPCPQRSSAISGWACAASCWRSTTRAKSPSRGCSNSSPVSA